MSFKTEMFRFNEQPTKSWTLRAVDRLCGVAKDNCLAVTQKSILRDQSAGTTHGTPPKTTRLRAGRTKAIEQRCPVT